MWIILIVVAVLQIVIYILSKNKYDDYIAPLDNKDYPLKELHPMGLYVMDAINYKYATRYDRKLLMQLAEVSGHKYAPYYLRIHWANKIVYVMLATLFLSIIATSMEPDIAFFFFCGIVLGSIIYASDKELVDKVNKRRLSIQIDFPDFINKLTLLINAGMTILKAWEKIVQDNKKQTPLYQELALVLSDIQAGKSEAQAYEDFAKRCRIPEITKFASVIVQNLRKGGAEIVSVLRIQSNECWEMRKNTAKRLGEEASTKMLLPMMIMFLALLFIVMTPAILSMQGI